MSRPNLSNYGTHGESAFPGYWDKVLRAWSPVLGQTGGRIYDFSRNNRWGITTGIDLATQWGTFRGNTGLSHDGVDDWVDFGSNDFSGTDFSVVSWFRILTAGVHFPYSLSAGTNSSGPEILYGPGFAFSQITSRLNGSGTGTLTYDFGSTSAALADPICFVQCFSDSQATKTHSIFVNGGNFQSTTYSISITPTQNWSWAKRGTQFFVAGGGGSNANGTCQWFEQIVFRGILTDSDVALIYRLGPGGIFQKRKRTYGKSIAVTPTFKNYWLQKSRSLIGGGVR